MPHKNGEECANYIRKKEKLFLEENIVENFKDSIIIGFSSFNK